MAATVAVVAEVDTEYSAVAAVVTSLRNLDNLVVVAT